MAAQPVTHPSADDLRAFALGKLNDSSVEALMNHLDSCPDCCKAIAARSGDDFLNRLRQARGPSPTPTPVKVLPAPVVGPKPSPSQLAIPHLPSELANNPQYEILRELGRGGMGVVYLAKNKLMDRLEVLKVVNKTLLDHPGAVERFLREIRSAAKLNHANVVGAYSAVQQGELLAFAMEYVEGQDLASVVKSQGPLPIQHACFYVQQAALGLQHAFEKGMVHRDIKPQNLILAREGKKHIVKVLDFGLAKATREKTDDTGLTGEGKMLGTPDYIAPEQTLDAAKADIRADIYSLGCTLYFLLSGHPPFSASSLGAILLAHQMHEAKPLNLVRPEVPEELAAVVRKMMAKSPAKRYQTPLDVVQVLAPFVKQATTPKASSGAVDVKPAVKKAAPVDPPAAPAVETPKTPPESAEVWESLTKGSSTSAAPRESAVIRHPRAATVRERSSRQKWLIGAGLGMGVLLLALLGMWASGVFTTKVKTPDGILIVEVNEPNPEVFVDSEKVTVSWHNDGKKAEIRVLPGTHKVEVKKDGFSMVGKELTFKDGDREVFTARLLPDKPEVKAEAPPLEKSPAQPDEKRAEPPSTPPNSRPVDAAPSTTSRNDYDDLAKGRWVAVLPSVEEFNRLRAEKAYIGPEPKFVDGVLHCDGGGMTFPPIKAKDAIVRAWVKKLGPKNNGNIHLWLRGVTAWFNGGGFFGIGRKRNNLWKDLTSCQLTEPYNDYFELALAAVGDRLIVYANGRKILEARDDAPLDCSADIRVGTHTCKGQFRNIEVQILDKPSVAEDKGFVPLFNGKDLTGWKTHPKQPGNWRVRNGVLIGSGPSITSHLYTERGNYADFHLRLEARINEGGNSGLYFRTPFGPTRPANQPRWLNGYNAKIDKTRLGGFLLDDPTVKLPLVRNRDPSVPAGQWLTMEVIVRGNHIVVKTNGETTAEYTDEKRCFAKGYIALQQHTPQTVVEFRKIEIKELPAEPQRVGRPSKK